MNRYWIWDPANTAGINPPGLLPDQIVSRQGLGQEFDPEKLLIGPRPWFVLRDWGAHPELGDQPATVKAAKN